MMSSTRNMYPELHGKGVHGGHDWVTSAYPHKQADGMMTNVQVKDDYGPNVLPPGATRIFSVGYISNTAEPNREGKLIPKGNETEIIYLATRGGQQKDIDTHDPLFIKAVNESGGNTANKPLLDGIYATVSGKPTYKMKLPIIKGHNYTNIIRDLGNNKGTLYQVLDTTSNQENHFIDHSLKGKTSAPAKQILNFDEWHH
jgi:hypothetical protein